jgi:hypothetical protein
MRSFALPLVQKRMPAMRVKKPSENSSLSLGRVS